MQWSDYFDYDESCPSFLRWKSGKPAGCLNEKGYYQVGFQRKICPCHRIVWQLHHGDIEEGLHIDHLDGDRGFNKIENLRLVTPAVNHRNRRKSENNQSGKTGVCRFLSCDSKLPRWRASWVDLGGKLRTKSFAVSIHGEDGARELACKVRDEMIEQMNRCGADYSERHGT